ncbi:uncharacterized protein si:ch211-250n8.1 isoform X2 [Colossoma macropomum]|uniref:uncharacterized protein si:ch211-250n8.1 isoform X2 n=1 Tax=Colossoma macropomum TaxID=42526 RepID=UPI001864ACBD|nr:uncharacterized protein si:ch211-250n8.1 isoform X2 [Colossoma macropomum]
MPVKDPLIETLKVCILQLQAEGSVTDSSPHLASCCELLELILRKGLQQPVLSLTHRDYWYCFEQLLQHDTCGRLSAVSLAAQQITACPKLLTAQGRGRFFIRLMLTKRTLENAVKHLLHTARVMEWYSPETSVLRNEKFVEPFLSLCLVLSEMEFKLNIENCSFLDESWLLPVCETYEAVPCRELGMVLRYLDGRVFVLELLQGGMAQVDMFAEPGDIIDEINGISLRNSSNGQAGVVLSRLKGQPLSLRLLRWRCEDGAMYRPLVPLLRQLKQENPSLQFSSAPQPSPAAQRQSQSQCVKEGRILYALQLLGKTNIGMYGGKEVLQHAIPAVLRMRQNSKEVLLDVKETHLTCTDKSNKQLFQHHFPEISCVGRFGQPDFTVFAFCVVDAPKTGQPKGFCCVVLQATSSTECEEIVHRIAAGFKNTEWFV